MNQKIKTPTSAKVTLIDLFINRRYRSGINFLLNVCKIKLSEEKREIALSILEEGSSIRSMNDNGISMTDKTSKTSKDSIELTKKLFGLHLERRSSRIADTFATLSSIMENSSQSAVKTTRH